MEDHFGGFAQNGQGDPYITGDPTTNFTQHPLSHSNPQPDLTPGAAFFHSLDQSKQEQPSQQFLHPSFEQNGFYTISPQTYFSREPLNTNDHQMDISMQYPHQLFPFATISPAMPEGYLQPLDFQYGSRLPNQYTPTQLPLEPHFQPHNHQSHPTPQFEVCQSEVKARANITDEHRKYLEGKFAETPYPSTEDKAALGARIGLPSDVITRWFERQRKVLGIRKDRLPQNTSMHTLHVSANTPLESVNKRSRPQEDEIDEMFSPSIQHGIAKTPEEVIKSSSLLKETLVHCVSKTSSHNAKEGIRFVFEVMKIATTDSQKLIILHGIRDNAKKEPLQLSDDTLRVVLIYSLSETQILARMRNWFTSAIKDKSLQMLVACLEVFKKMPITTEALANVKLAKPILLAVKKYPESSAIGALSKYLVPMAQKAASIDGKTGKSEFSIEEAPKKKPKLTNSSITETLPLASIKPSASSRKGVVTKPLEKVATSANSNFFKNIKDPIKTTKPAPAKPSQQSISSLINSINVTKKKPGGSTTRAGPPASVLTQALGQPKDKPVAEVPSTCKPAVSRKRKRVTWAPDHELEKVKIIEALDLNPEIDLEYDGELFYQTPHQFGNARDLDISEGRAAFSRKNLDIDDDEDDVPWTIPIELDFSEMKKSEEVNIDTWAAKRGGVRKPESREAGVQSSREQDVLAVLYVKEQDIPPSPAEPLPGSEGEILHTRTIPLPYNLKILQNPQTVANFPPHIPNLGQVDLQALLGSILGGKGHQNMQQSTVGPALSTTPLQVQAPIDLGMLLQNIQCNTGATSISNQCTSPAMPLYNTTHPSLQPVDPNPETDGALKLRDVRPFVVTAPPSGKYRQLCKFYGEGKCRKGNDCDYIHLAPPSQ